MTLSHFPPILDCERPRRVCIECC